ncbi:MAG: hypothetical protein VKP62_11355 [Candidatus Sericytochromatia bacterium]|nr:hypothetical protein [Candidatus Sericytochromatia bacterium]
MPDFRRGWWALLLISLPCLLGARQGSPPLPPGGFHSPSPQAVAWPAGPGQALVTSRCLFCHEAELIVAQRLTPAQWDKEVHKMVKWGAPLTPEEQRLLAAYLARHYGPDQPPYQPRPLDLPRQR